MYEYENIIQNFADFVEITDEAQLELERIKLEFSKINYTTEKEIQNDN